MSQEPSRASLVTRTIIAPEGLAHAEPVLMPGEESNTNANVPTHPVGTGPEVLLEEGGTAEKDACTEDDGIPRGELQEPGVSHLTTPEEAESLTSSPPSHITPEAASMQRPPAVNTMTPGILQPDRRAGLEPPHDTPPPTTSEAARTQCSPAANTGTPAILDPEGNTDLMPPPPP